MGRYAVESLAVGVALDNKPADGDARLALAEKATGPAPEMEEGTLEKPTGTALEMEEVALEEKPTGAAPGMEEVDP